MRVVLAGRDVLAVMTPGSGKSLGSRLSAVLLPGTTIVAPLVALMKAQLLSCKPARLDRKFD